MSELIYSIVMWTARIHDEIMGMNDGWGYYNCILSSWESSG